MKRNYSNYILFMICSLLFFWSCMALANGMRGRRTQEAISAKVLRFHVVAKSDSADDQRRKLLVRDAVGEWLNEKLSGVESREVYENFILRHQKEIETLAKKTLEADGESEQVTVQLVDIDFPEKTYGDYSFPAGTYRALQIIIGEGAGHNWWCVLYPNLCFSGDGYDKTAEKAHVKLMNVLSASEYYSLLKHGDYKLDTKYFRFLKKNVPEY